MKQQLKSRLYTLLPLLLSILFILASVGLFYYIKGYRFDFQTQQISNTGVLTIDTIPSRSSLYVNDKTYGKTPKSVSLKGGDHDIKIERDGYHDWSKSINITEGKSSSIYPWLITDNIKSESIFTSSKIIDTNHIYQNDNSIFFILYEDLNNTRNYELWRLSTDSAIWDFSENPSLVLTFDSLIDSEFDFNILPSNDSSIVLFSLNNNSVKSRYLIETNKQNILDNLSPITLNGFTDYSISWSKSDEYLILESDGDIFSYDIDTEIKYLITKKSTDTFYTFTTDTEGLIYLMTGILEEDIYNYSLSQYLPNGTLQKELLPNIYFYNSSSYLEDYKSEGTNDYSLPFKNSQESTKTCGKITSFSVETDVNGVFIKTEFAGYWYDITSTKFILISPYSTNLIGISPLKNQLLYQNTKEIGVLTFDIEDGAPDQYIGKKSSWGLDSTLISNIQWLSTGKNVIFIKEEKMYVSDYEGENVVVISSNPPLFISNEQDPSKVFTATIPTDGGIEITELDIH